MLICDRAPAENLGRTCILRASCRSLSVARQGPYSVTMQAEVTAGIRGARYKEPRGGSRGALWAPPKAQLYVDVSRLAAQVSLGAQDGLWAVQDEPGGAG